MKRASIFATVLLVLGVVSAASAKDNVSVNVGWPGGSVRVNPAPSPTCVYPAYPVYYPAPAYPAYPVYPAYPAYPSVSVWWPGGHYQHYYHPHGHHHHHHRPGGGHHHKR